MTKDGSTKTVNSMTPEAGIIILGCEHISNTEKVHYIKLSKSTSAKHYVYATDDQNMVYQYFT